MRLVRFGEAGREQPGLIDANGRGRDGFEIGPGALITIPIFNGNRGQMALADARLQQAMRNYITVRDQIVLDVRTSLIQVEQAQQNLTIVQDELLPSVEEAVGLARRNYERGAVPYFLVLQSTAQFLDSRTRELEQEAALRRSVAELERSVGRRFLTAPQHVLEVVPAPEVDGEGPELPLPPTPPVPSAPMDAPSAADDGKGKLPPSELVPVAEQRNGAGGRVITAIARISQGIGRPRQPRDRPDTEASFQPTDAAAVQDKEKRPTVVRSQPPAGRPVPTSGFRLTGEKMD